MEEDNKITPEVQKLIDDMKARDEEIKALKDSMNTLQEEKKQLKEDIKALSDGKGKDQELGFKEYAKIFMEGLD